MNRYGLPVVLVFVVCLCCCSLGFGQQLTSGSIQLNPGLGPPSGTFNVSGTADGGFAAGGSFNNGVWNAPEFNAPSNESSLLSITGYSCCGDVGGGASLGGQSLDVESLILIVNGPDIVVNHGAGDYSGTFTAEVCVVTFTGNNTCVPDFTGIGTVAVDLGIDSANILFFEDATYTITPPPPPAALPEPSSLLLLSMGILGLVGRSVARVASTRSVR